MESPCLKTVFPPIYSIAVHLCRVAPSRPTMAGLELGSQDARLEDLQAFLDGDAANHSWATDGLQRDGTPLVAWPGDCN